MREITDLWFQVVDAPSTQRTYPENIPRALTLALTRARVNPSPSAHLRQVSEGRGSRVLLRTSMVRSLVRAPRECMESASDLAAFFSDARRADEVKVMYTDSRHVAKRGGRVGQLKESKRLGVVWAKPARVADEARDAQEEQGWL